MTKLRWNESMYMFRDHVDQEKEQHLKQIIIETDTKVERIVKLVKSANSGNKDAKLKRRSEAIHLIEDFYKQYQSMCAMYEDLREGVKRKCYDEEVKDDNESCASSCSSSNLVSMESSAYHSAGSGSKTPSIDQLKSVNSSYSLESLNDENSCKEEGGGTAENLMKETENLKDYKYANLENKSPSKMKVLEERFNALKLEIETLNCPRSEYEHEWKGRHDDLHKRNKENSGFRIQLAFKEKEGDVLKKLDECEKILKDKIDKSIVRVQDLQMEVDSLRSQKYEVRQNFACEKVHEMSQESEIELKKKNKEAADSIELLECLTEKLKQKTKNEEGLIEERNSLKTRIQDLEIKIESINDKNKKQSETISQLEEILQEKGQITTLESNIECVKKDLSNKIKSLEQKYKSLEIDKREVEGKNDLLAATLEQKDAFMSKLNHEAKSSFKATVKKMGEMVDEFRFKTEDSIRILSRRIRVAEQLHNETREWYKKTLNKHEQDRRENELAFHSIKIISSMVSETLNFSETIGLRFVECCEDFSNRVSKVSCESNFVKDWVKRKNGVMVQVKDDFDKLVVQMDAKEEEILGSRQKVLKLEARLREVEKIVKENDETLIVLKEEKREAIRQLCVWIDFHRNRYDSLKKAFSEFVARNQKPG